MIRKRGNSYGVSVYDPRRGEKIWVGTYPLEREAKKAERDALNRLATTQTRDHATCDHFAQTWVDRFPRPKESTNRHNHERVRKFADDFKGVVLGEVTRAQARTWALANPSHVASVRAMFNDAIRDELLDSNPFEDLRLPRSRGRRDLIVPTVTQVDQLIEAARGKHGKWGELVYAPMIEFAAYTGLRAGEVFGLRFCDVDLAAGTVRVERQWNVKLQKVTSTKSGKPRTVHLSSRARRAFETVPRHDSPLEVFLTPHGRRFSGGSVTYWWYPVRAAAGLPELPWHALRHFYGTWLANQGVGPIQIASMMGHQDGGKLAMDLYIHMSEQDALASVARVLGEGGPAAAPVSPIRRTA